MAATFPVELGGSGNTYDNASFALGGHRMNFIPALEDVIAVAETTANNAIQVAADKELVNDQLDNAEIFANNALLSANIASSQAGVATEKAAQADASADSAALSLQGTLASAGLSGAKAYSSFALANADFSNLVNNQPVFVVTDETRGNQGAYYRATGTPVSSLTFLRLHEFYSSPVSYIQSDSIQNMITKLLVLTGMIPEVSPSLDADFTNPSYL